MEPDEAYRRVIRSYTGDVGSFYAPGTTLGLGKGLLMREAIFAQFDDDTGLYRTAQGAAYVLTHECDVDEENDRVFNADILVCPLIPLEAVVDALREDLNADQLVSFCANLGARNISRLVYLPPFDGCQFGGVMALNQITNATTDALRDRAAVICAVTAHGLAQIEYALENHLLRPKADRLALS